MGIFDALGYGPLHAWVKTQRERHGYAVVGVYRADPHIPGPLLTAYARDHDNNLFYRVMLGGHINLEWRPITEEEWVERWPHSKVPPRWS